MIAIIVAIAFVVSVSYIILIPAKFWDKGLVEINVKNGDGVYAVARMLEENGLIRSQNIFVLYVQSIGQEKSLKAGKYLVSHSLNLPQIVSILVEGLSESEDILVTIPEGFNVWEVDRKFVNSGLIKSGQISKEYLHKEGHLFPDSYRFKEGTLPEDIVNKMEDNYFTKGRTRSDITIIIASLLEKEARTKQDMELISGIIAKRLEKDMALQMDAAVAYGWCVKQSVKSAFRGFCDVTQAPIASEIQIDGPYNTYFHKGLPQGPISNPGIIAIQAAENPKASDYLYYLSTRDSSQIIYAKTPGEQAANRRKYLGI